MLRGRAGVSCGVRLIVREFDLFGFRNGVKLRGSDYNFNEVRGQDGAG